MDQGFISRTALDTSISNSRRPRARRYRPALAAVEWRARRWTTPCCARRSPAWSRSAWRSRASAWPSMPSVVEIVDLSRSSSSRPRSAPRDSVAVRVGQQARAAGRRHRRPVLGARGAHQPQRAGRQPQRAGLPRASTTHRACARACSRRARIDTGRQPALAVPLSAVRTDKPAPYVQVVENGKVAHKPVDARRARRGGSTARSMVAVESGRVQPGDTVLRAAASARCAKARRCGCANGAGPSAGLGPLRPQALRRRAHR